MNQLPPFPVDDATLDLLMAAIDPRSHGDTDAEQSNVGSFLEFMAELGGSDTKAIAEVIDDGSDGGAAIHMMRDQHYHTNNVLEALVTEVRRLRTAAGAARTALGP